MKKDIVFEFKKVTGDLELYPPFHNYSPFIQGSGFNQAKYFDDYYEEEASHELIIIVDKNNSIQYLTAECVKISASEIFRKYLSDQSILDKKEKEFLKYILKVDDLYGKMTYEYINGSDWKSLLDHVEEVMESIWKANALAFFSLHFDKDFCEEETNEANFDISKQELNEIFDKEIDRTFYSFDKEQLIYVLRSLGKNKNLEDLIEYCQYFFVSYWEVDDSKKVKEKLYELYGKYEDEVVRENRLESEKAKLDSEKVSFEKRIGSSNNNQKIIIEWIQSISRIRDRRKNFLGKGLTITWRVAQKMFKEVGVSEELIPFYTMEELLKGVEYLELNKNSLQKRPNGFGLLSPRRGKILITDNIDSKKAKAELKKYYLEKISGMRVKDKITGQIGSKGFIEGTVKVILDARRGDEFKDGEVLVTGMTRPEYVPIMKKASAIVTDEGGITCHAAIISRELKKPCIIGTKIATQVLKDGDLVEVDADEGVVKILKKYKG